MNNTYRGIKKLTLISYGFSLAKTIIWHKDIYVIKDNGNAYYRKFEKGDMFRPSEKREVSTDLSTLGELLNQIDKLAVKKGISKFIPDDECGEVRIDYEDGRSIIIPRSYLYKGESLYFLLEDYFVSLFKA